MLKLSLARFREIKERVAEIFDLTNKIKNEEIQVTEEDGEKLESEIEQLIDEIHSSDLSDIPFEEYEGFYDLGFDFSGTDANIDFNIIREVGWGTVRLKGCNVRNFDFENQNYDEESFDEEFMNQHLDRFIDRGLPQEVRQRYYWKSLEIADIIRYDLYDEIENGRASRDAVEFFAKVKPEIAMIIEPDLFNVSNLSYSIISSLENYEEEITEDTIKKLIIENLENVLSRSYLDIETYKRIVNNPNIRALVSEELIIDFGENDELASRYLREKLTLSDVHENAEMFRGKRFLSKLSGFRYSQERFEGTTEEKIFYLFENFPDIADGIATEQSLLFSVVRSIDLEATKEENLKSVQTQVIEILNSNNSKYLDPDAKKLLERYYSIEAVQDRLSEYKRGALERIMRYTTQEQIESYGISLKLFEDDGIRSLFESYGLETVMEFDRANGSVFSKNDFALAKKMSDYYFHYAANVHDPNRTIYHRSKQPEDWSAPYSMDDFEECVRRMIVEGPTDGNYSRIQPIDFRDFSQEFKNKFPRMFLAEDAPQDLQDKFYTKMIDIGDLGIHPEWISYLEGRDFELGIQSPYIYFRNPEKYEYTSFFEELRKLEGSESTILNFINDNAKTLKMAEMYQRKSRKEFKLSFEEIKDLYDFRAFLEGEVEPPILSGALEYGEPYIPDFFKTKHPELILAEDVPEELKAKFYSLYFEEGKEENRANLHNFTLQDLTNEEYQEFLVGKSFDLLRNADAVKNITKLFDLKTIADLYKIDPSAFELYCFNLENANILKEVLDNYPEQYAKEELMQGQKLSEEEFETRLQDEEFKSKFEALKRGYIEDFIKNPGFVLHLEPEKRSRETLRQYKELSSSNMLHNSNRFSRDSYEQILGHMLGFLEYDEAKKLLEIPEIDEETLSRIYEQDEVIKSLYEKKFEITGNLKIISKLLEGFPGLMPTPEKITSKSTCKLFMSLNKRIQEGYDKDITSLITEILAENNVEIDNDKVNQLVEKVIGISTSQKLDLVRENNSMVIDTSIEENQKTKNMIKIHYRNALEYSLKQSERVDPNLVREYLEIEFGRLREDGQSYYSPHVTEHLEELISFAEELSSNPEWSKKLNHSLVDDLGVEARKIGKGWIRKITSNLCYRPEKLTYEEAERLDSMIYPEESGLEIDTRATIGLRELSEEERAKVYELLTNEEYRGLFTYGKAENMFSAIKLPYSKKFRDYFLKHKDEFIANPDLYAKFPIIASKFDTYLEEAGFNTRYIEGTLTPDDILMKLSTDVYPNLEVGKGEHEVVYQARDAGLSEEQARIAIRLFKDMSQREYQTVPQEQFKTRRFRGRIVRMDDPLHFAIGEITNCCQTIGEGQPGESSMVHSAIERNGALFVVEELDETGRSTGIVSQSWTWRNGNRVCFDNVEVPNKVESQLKQIGGFDEIMEVYQEAGKRMIETDRTKLRKLLESGKITQEQYQSMLIKDVGMGLGCDNLFRNLSPEKRATIPRLESVAPLEAGKTYTGAHSRTLYFDSSRAVLVAHNDDFAPNDHVHTNGNVVDYGVRYVKTRDIFRRKGFDIDQDKVEAISAIVQKSDRRDSAFADNPSHISEVASHFGIHDLGIADADRIRISMSDTGDWYILYEETEDGIVMLESGIDTTQPETEVEKADRKMALGEYTREVHKIMLDSAMKGKPMTIDIYSLNKFINLDSLIDEGTISIENSVIVVKDTERLTEVIDDYNKIIDGQRRERLTISDKEEKDV